MRTPSYDVGALATEIGQAGAVAITSANRHLVQNWLVAQGVPSVRAKAMKLATLAKAYNRPRYLAAIKAHLGDSAGIIAANPGSDDLDDAAADLASDAAEPAVYDSASLTAAQGELIPAPAPRPLASGDHIPPRSAVGDQLAALIGSIAGESVNEARVIELIRQHAPRAPVHEIAVTDTAGTRREIGRQHRQFELLLRACSARDHNGNRLNLMLVGSAGSGKTTAAENVATALGVPFYFNGAIDNEYKLLGFTDAQGRIVSRPFRQAYEGGGVYLFDELDASLPGALLAFNAATANGQCDFPDGMIRRHKDCVIIAAANTFGHGAAGGQYVGRMKQDAAFLDRFATIAWEVDEELERDLCPNAEWCGYVQAVRGRVAAAGTQVIVSPRASFYGASLLAAGIDRENVVAMTLRKGMSPDQWRAVAG